MGEKIGNECERRCFVLLWWFGLGLVRGGIVLEWMLVWFCLCGFICGLFLGCWCNFLKVFCFLMVFLIFWFWWGFCGCSDFFVLKYIIRYVVNDLKGLGVYELIVRIFVCGMWEGGDEWEKNLGMSVKGDVLFFWWFELGLWEGKWRGVSVLEWVLVWFCLCGFYLWLFLGFVVIFEEIVLVLMVWGFCGFCVCFYLF